MKSFVRPMAMRGVCLIGCACWTAALTAAPPRDSAQRDRIAPPVRPQLLLLTTVGGKNDQHFMAVRHTRSGVQATDGTGLLATVAWSEDGKPLVKVRGNRHAPSKRSPDALLDNGGTVAGVQYGYKQVHPILQQPFARGKGWTLWDFTHEQAKKRQLMADSRIRHGRVTPGGNLLLIGWCDGGNTVLHRDPRDIDKKSPHMGYQFGGGRGVSLLLSEVTPGGEVVGQAFLGTGLGTVLWDPWGRLIAVGTNLCRGGKPDFVGDSSGSVLMLDRTWKTALLDARLGNPGGSYKDNMWHAAALNPKTGLLALGGWTSGALARPVGDEPEAGDGKDAMLAVLRLWTPEDYAQSVEAEKALSEK